MDKKIENKAATEVQTIKASIPLSDALKIDGKEVKELIIREPKASDLKNISISNVLNHDSNAIGLLMQRIADNIIVDRQMIRDTSIANINAMVEGISLFIDDSIDDIEAMITQEGKITNLKLAESIIINGKIINRLKFNQLSTGELRGYSFSDIQSLNINAICKIAPRLLLGLKLTTDDFFDMSIANILLVGNAIAGGLVDEGLERPKLIKN